MASPSETPFEELFEETGAADIEFVVDDSVSEPVLKLLGEAFETQPVTIRERTVSDQADEVVLLRNGERVATSPLEKLMNAFLLVNGDLYRTGTSGIDKYEAPDVLTELDDTVFHLQGFPESNKQKLLLILVSRHIERIALEAGEGRLDSAFQHLSRLDDEYGTRSIYRRLCETNLDVNVYGVPDRELPDEIEVTRHTGSDELYRRCWFVVYTPPPNRDDAAALVAVERENRVWEGMWTYDPDRVEWIRSTVETHF